MSDSEHREPRGKGPDKEQGSQGIPTQERLLEMMESMADGLILVMGHEELAYANRAARAVLGIEAGAAVTTRYLKERLGFYPFDLVRGQRASAPGSSHLLSEQIRFDDKVLHSVVSAVGPPGAEPVGVVIALRDIPDPKPKEDLVAIVSHEIRTPLTSIAGALDIVLNNYPQSLGDKARRYITMAREGCSRLQSIADDLLDVAKLDYGALRIQQGPILLDALVRDSVARFRPAAEQKQIDLNCVIEKSNLRAVGDEGRLRQVLGNLLSNALKFTPEKGQIAVELFGSSVSSTHIGCSLWNNGEPIPQEAHERIFEKFETANRDSQRRVGGTGLGLSISRAIVQGHGGHIWIEPVSQGAKFVFTLPCAIPNEPLAAPPSSELADKVALVVSDRDPLALILKGILLRTGWKVLRTQGADDTLTVAREEHPDLIVLDLALESDIALALIEILKHDPETKEIPLLGLAHTERSEIARGRDADGMLVLPISGETLVEYTSKLVLHRGARNPARVLVVDDDAMIRSVCQEVLEQAGYLVQQASDGQAALDAIARTMPDLVVLDIMMPRCDGHQVLRRLRQSSLVPPPVILLSARGQSADKVLAFKSGAEDYLVKPFDNTELVLRVDKALERRVRELGASPNTRLPGSCAIEMELGKRLEQRSDFVFCYVDVDNLKAFNDYYGYAKADGVIRQTGDILRDALAREGNQDDFIGHIAGDDFVLMATRDRIDRICQRLIETFDRLIPLYYDRADRVRGYIETPDRYGQVRKFEVLSISVVGLSYSKYRFEGSAEVARLAASFKRRAKEIPGSVYTRDGDVVIQAPKKVPLVADPASLSKRDAAQTQLKT